MIWLCVPRGLLRLVSPQRHYWEKVETLSRKARGEGRWVIPAGLPLKRMRPSPFL